MTNLTVSQRSQLVDDDDDNDDDGQVDGKIVVYRDTCDTLINLSLVY